MGLNEARRSAFYFYVFEHDGYAWIYDDSTRTFACSSTPSVYAEVLYPINRDDDDDGIYPDPAYFTVNRFIDDGPQMKGAVKVVMIDADVPEREAWDEAREEACANCRI